MLRALLLIPVTANTCVTSNTKKPGKRPSGNGSSSSCDSITAQLKDDLLAKDSSPRPRDFQQRLEDILFQTAVIPSAHRGLLGDLKRLTICGDGSSLPTGASCAGKPSCLCRKDGIFKCSCDRFYSDPTANWGWDSYREVFYFGHTYYQHVVSSSGHDLPIHLIIGQASQSDFTLSLKSFDRLFKTARENNLDLKIEAIGYNAGHDARGIYFKQIMNLRSGCERSNAIKKTVHHLDDRPCRSETHFLFRLYLVSIVEHAKAWVAEDRKLVGDDLLKLCDLALKQGTKT